MPYNDCEAEHTSVPISMAEFLAKNLTPERRKNCEILKTFNDDSVAIYMAGIAILQMKDFPAKQSVVAHCFRELINAIVRSEESVIKKQAIDGLKEIDFIKNGNHCDEKITDTVNAIWQNLKSLNNENSKLFSLFIERNPKKQQELLTATSKDQEKQIRDSIYNALKPFLEAKSKINKLRHFDEHFSTLSEFEFDKTVNVLENFISSLDNAQYVEKKEALDGILAAANAKRN